eukprot:gb/GECH01003397.1/.p1 GENE.gb/GECH01003397.1/~~gb/GECH01003397.1/.p1  ORF type:complete len:957 (+),score=273.86 gb/GECH01003397.1/:1-2871(+)
MPTTKISQQSTSNMTQVAYTTCSGTLSLLHESDNYLKTQALQQLDSLVESFWTEIADSIAQIESLYEDENFPARKQAALVASKVYYHLGELEESLMLALGAEDLFDVRTQDEYTNTLASKAIDRYSEQSKAKAEGENIKIDSRLEDMVERMLNGCLDDGQYQQALGIGLESRRPDIVEKTFTSCTDKESLLRYCFNVISFTTSRNFRQQILRVLVKHFLELKNPDYLAVMQCLVSLNDTSEAAKILNDLLQGNKEQTLIAFQAAFDLCDTAPQHFLRSVRENLPSNSTGEEEDNSESTIDTLKEVLTGRPLIEQNLDFLYRKNHADLLILKNIKETVESRSSVYHNATVISNAIMHAGTTVDQFLRDNLEWLGKATNWAKFSATASLGVIHKGQLQESLTVLGPYLPGTAQSSQPSPYSEGGALYALGIIHSNHGDDMTNFLLNSLRNTDSDNETVQHGACLGLGLAAMATSNEEIYGDIRNVLYYDNAVAGEAAGVAMGMVMLGSAAEEPIEEMIAYAHETQHEKIIRGLAMGIALTMYGREDQAETLIEQLAGDKDPILRYGGMFTTGLAYCGTSSNSAIRRLLHIAVSDVSDDVRRAAVLNLGFVLINRPEQCPRLVSLLAESYNPHVRYGTALSLGISCAGTGMKEALDLLLPLTKDRVDFVRQGALISLAMVLIQFTEAQEPKVKEVRELFENTIKDRHEELMTRFGAILATGIIDGGGRNCTLALHRSGRNKMRGIVGLAMFSQYWFWYPFIHFIALTLEPTAVIGLNEQLKMPKFQFKSNAKPSQFAYPESVKPPEKEENKKLPTAVLSTTHRAKARASKKAEKKSSEDASGGGVEKMDVEDESKSETEEKDKEKEKQSKQKKSTPEPTSEILENPARVVPLQSKVITYDVDQRYSPVDPYRTMGVVMLKDDKPEQEETLVQRKVGKPGQENAEDEENEPEPPEPFEWP